MLGSFGSGIFGQNKYVDTFCSYLSVFSKSIIANLQRSYVIQALLTKHSTPFKVPMIQQ